MFFYQEIAARLKNFYRKLNMVTFVIVCLICLLTWGIYKAIDFIPYLSNIMMEVEGELKNRVNLHSKYKTWRIVMDIIIEILCKILWHLILLPYVVIILHTIPLIYMNVREESWSVITMTASTFATMFNNSQLTNKFKFIIRQIFPKKKK